MAIHPSQRTVQPECGNCDLCYDLVAAEHIFRLCTSSYPNPAEDDPSVDTLVEKQMLAYQEFLAEERLGSALLCQGLRFWWTVLDGLIENLEQSPMDFDQQIGNHARELMENNESPGPVLEFLNAQSYQLLADIDDFLRCHSQNQQQQGGGQDDKPY